LGFRFGIWDLRPQSAKRFEFDRTLPRGGSAGAHNS